MAEVRIQEEIAASADAVWKVISDFGGVDRWFPNAANVQVEGSGVGAVRTVPLGSSKVRERLEVYDPAAREFAYSILEAPIPVRDYLVTVRVEALGAQRCRVHWTTRFEPVGVPADPIATGLEGLYRAGLRKIAELVAA